jgi:hypothetical protein
MVARGGLGRCRSSRTTTCSRRRASSCLLPTLNIRLPSPPHSQRTRVGLARVKESLRGRRAPPACEHEAHIHPPICPSTWTVQTRARPASAASVGCQTKPLARVGCFTFPLPARQTHTQMDPPMSALPFQPAVCLSQLAGCCHVANALHAHFCSAKGAICSG